MSAHLAAAALGYATWWISVIGEEVIQEEFRRLLGMPGELLCVDIMCFGPPLKASDEHTKKKLAEIMSWGWFDGRHFVTDAQLDEWIRNERRRAMYGDPSPGA